MDEMRPRFAALRQARLSDLLMDVRNIFSGADRIMVQPNSR